MTEQPAVDNSITTPGFNISNLSIYAFSDNPSFAFVAYIDCPVVDLPKLAPGCTIGPFVTDANGCQMPGDVICSTGIILTLL